MRKIGYLIPAALLAIGIGASAGGASPATSPALSTSGSSIVVQVAGRECMRDERGWHYMDRDRRRDCKPPRPQGRDWNWRCDHGRCGWWHGRENRWND